MPIQHLLILLCGVKTNIMFANLSVISSVLKCVSLQVLYVINVIKAYVFELSWMYIIGLLSYFLNKSIFKLVNFNIVYSQNFTSPLLYKLFIMFFADLQSHSKNIISQLLLILKIFFMVLMKQFNMKVKFCHSH